MAFFGGLVIMYFLLWLVSLLVPGTALADPMLKGVWAAAIMFLLVGISHFAKPDKLEAMIPQKWPYKRALNYLSGLAEIILGIGLCFNATRVMAACGLIVLLVFIFPANIYVAMKKRRFYSISRLFFQPLYILWLWWFCLR